MTTDRVTAAAAAAATAATCFVYRFRATVGHLCAYFATYSLSIPARRPWLSSARLDRESARL